VRGNVTASNIGRARAPLCGVEHLQVPIAVVRGYRTIQLYGVLLLPIQLPNSFRDLSRMEQRRKGTNKKQTTVAFARRESYHWLVMPP
jgi:hypothetical protein